MRHWTRERAAVQLVCQTLWRVDDIDASSLHSLSAGAQYVMLCNKPLEKVTTIIPGRATPSGVTHAYKANGQWKFIPEDEYEARKGELPRLSFAIQYPFSDYEGKAS